LQAAAEEDQETMLMDLAAEAAAEEAIFTVKLLIFLSEHRLLE
jgi:hypothetical protein